MARDTRAAFERAIGPHLTAIEEAFLDAIFDMRSVAAQRTMEEILQRFTETGNVEQAVQDIRAAIQFGARGFFAPLDRQVSEAVTAGAVYQLSLLPKRSSPTAPRLVVRFDQRRPAAEEASRKIATALIQEISVDTDRMIRETLTEAIEDNRPFRKLARDLIGTTEGNKRTGGLIGLHSRQAAAVRAARRDLETLDANYFTRARRDKRFDGTVRKAIEAGKPLSAADVDRITGRYADRLLALRGQTIARTEALRSASAGRALAVDQMIEDGQIPASAVTKVWRATIGKFTRDSHAALHGQEVPWGQRFISPVTGAALRYPHDEDASGAETINCFPANQPIHLGGLEAAVSSTYRGEVVQILGGNGVDFSVTPNHPVLTERGWVPAGLIVEGDKLLYSRVGDIRRAAAEPDVGDWYASAEKVHQATKVCGTSRRASRAVVNLHGHVPGHDVDVVTLPGHLRRALDTMTREIFGHEVLSVPDVTTAGESAFGILMHGGSDAAGATHGFVSGFRSVASFIFGHLRRGSPIAFGNVRSLKAKIAKASVDRSSGRTDHLGYAKHRFSGIIEALDVRKVFGPFFAPVFGGDLALVPGSYLSGDGLQPQVGEAARNLLLTDAHAAGHGVDHLARFMAALDLGEKRLARLPEARLNDRSGVAGETCLADDVAGRGIVEPELCGHILRGQAGLISRDDGGVTRFTAVEVTKVDRHDYDGPVYDFQSSTGMLLASGFVVHNCRCTMATRIDFTQIAR